MNRFICCQAILHVIVVSGSVYAADHLVLNNGDTLTGTVVDSNDSTVTFDHSVLGRIVIDRSQIQELTVDPLQVESSAGPPTSKQESVPDEDWLTELGLFKGWSHKLEAGLDGSNGNSESLNLRAAYGGDYEDDEKVWHALARYLRSSSDGDTSQSEFLGSIERQWKLPESRWFYFAMGS